MLLAVDREDGATLGEEDQELLAVLATFAAIAVRTSRSLARERARAEALARLRQTQTDAEARRETLRAWSRPRNASAGGSHRTFTTAPRAA